MVDFVKWALAKMSCNSSTQEAYKGQVEKAVKIVALWFHWKFGTHNYVV